MALTPISNTVEFVQDTVPTTAADGDSWLDTSLTPPRLKIFDADVGGFTEPRSIQNLDAPVSNAGATQSDIETAVDNSNTASTVSNNLDAKVSNAVGLDLASKTPKTERIQEDTTFSVSGAGFIISLGSDVISLPGKQSRADISIDGTTINSVGAQMYNEDANDRQSHTLLYRFDSSFAITEKNGSNDLRVNYVLD